MKKAGKTILMSDLESDPMIMLQHNHYMKCFFLAAFVIPTLVPHLCWGESLSTAYFMAVLRLVIPAVHRLRFRMSRCQDPGW